jgi:hypothetical protein
MIATRLPENLGNGDSHESLLEQPLPPSERDFDVFLLVAVENASTRAAAAQFGVSQTRIIQIRDRVAEWMAKNVPAVRRLSVRERVQLAAQIATERTNFLYSQVLEAWHNSSGEETVVRTNGRGETTKVRRSTQGDPRYLLLAMRINEHSLRLAGRAEEVLAKAVEQAGQTDAQDAAMCGSTGIPPAGDCSTLVAAEAVQATAASAAAAASADAAEDCDDMQDRRREFFTLPDVAQRPVQPAELAAEEPGALLLAAGAESLSPPVDLAAPPRSRKERRAQLRLLKKLRQAHAR